MPVALTCVDAGMAQIAEALFTMDDALCKLEVVWRGHKRSPWRTQSEPPSPYLLGWFLPQMKALYANSATPEELDLIKMHLDDPKSAKVIPAVPWCAPRRS
jgi:hypothetical protein